MSLAVASRGYFCDDQPIGVATRGYFCGNIIRPVEPPTGVGSIPTYLPDNLTQQLRQEDEELMLILSAFLRIID